MLAMTMPPVASAKANRWFYLGCMGLVLLIWDAYLIHVQVPLFPFDDAYIALHSAQSVLLGRDPNYIGTPALSGVTSVVHVALISVLLTVLPPLWALDASQWLAVLLYVSGLARLAFANGANRVQAALIVLAGLTLGRVPHQLFNGMETGLVLGALTWALVFASDPKFRRSRWTPLFYGQLPFVRPELVLVTVFLLALRVWDRKQDGLNARANARVSAADLALAGVGALPWLLWYKMDIGSFIPSTIRAKQNFFAESCWPPVRRCILTWHHLQTFAGTLGILTAGAVLLFLTPLGWIGIGFFLAFVYAYCVNLPGALAHYDQRYLYVFIPFLLYGIASSLRRRPKALRIGVMALLAVGVCQSLWNVRSRWNDHRAQKFLFTAHELEGVADWCRRNLPSDAILLVHDAGYISFATPFRMFDLVGLKTPAILPIHYQETLATCGMARGDAISRIGQLLHTNYLVILDAWDEQFRITETLRLFGWRLEPLRILNPKNPVFQYQVYHLAPPAPSQPNGPHP